MEKHKDSNHFKNRSLFKILLHIKLVIAIILVASLQLSAKTFPPLNQDIKVSGRVVSSTGDVISGVSVKIKGSAVGTFTDASGRYSLSVPDGARLQFSSIGYISQEVAVNGRSEINIVLQQTARIENEVVVIGYGVANKRDLTGSIVKIAGKDVADKPNSNPVASLQGKVAGLSVVNNGTPGQEPDIRIRGTVSIGQVHPLYVVDGLFSDNIDYINPDDIESIEVLKDPSSLAIFGVRGATGVIAITTKKAKLGQTIVNFNTSYGVKKLVDKIKWANASQFSTLFAEENANNNVATPDYSKFTANTDWINAVTRKGVFNTNNLSVANSTEKNKFKLGVGYTTDQGIIRHEELSKMLLNLNDEITISKHLKLGVNLDAVRQNLPYDATWVLNAARKVMPQISALATPFKIVNPYGSDTISANLYSTVDPALQSGGVENPLITLENEWNKTINIQYRYAGSAFAEVNFLKHFTFRSTFYADLLNQDKRQYTPLYNAYNYQANSLVLEHPITQINETQWANKQFQSDQILTYAKKFGNHNITATGGFTTFYLGNFNTTGVAQPLTATSPQIPNDKRFWYLSNYFTSQSTSNVVSGQNEYSTVSELFRVLYNYKAKYFLNASFRNDASSRLLPANRNQQFWSVGGAWEISKEDFMQNQHFFNFLKLKASVGVLGNQSASYLDGSPINYPAYPLLNNTGSGNGITFNNSIFSAATAPYAANPNLKWETVSAQEVGVEFSALNNRLHFEGTYFNKTTNNLMTYIDRSAVALPNELTNAGSIKNWGEEFAATWNKSFSKDLSLSIGGNITFLKNKVVSLSPDIPNGILDVTTTNNGQAISETTKGMPIGYFKGMIESGVFQSYSDIISSPSQAALGVSLPGDIKYKDVNGDGVVDYSDRTYIGNPTPKFTYGGNINLTYKNFNLGVDVGGVYGNYIYRTWGSLDAPFQRVNYAGFQTERWHGAGTSNWVPRLSQGDRINYVGSTFSMEDGSYFRIRNIQLGYSFANNMTNKAHFKSLRLFVNMQNPKTWKHNMGYSPEFGGSATQFGYDNGGGAIPAITTFGLNATF